MDHHYIFGKTIDYLSGQELVDTHDERYRQEIARMLVEEKGYAREDVLPRLLLKASAGDESADLVVDFAVKIGRRVAMIVRYAPGSLVTRHRPSLAASRLLEPYQIPLVVVTNGEGAEILEGKSGNVIGRSFLSIPSKHELAARISNTDFESISEKRREMESRIIYTFEAVGHCNCC